MNFDPLIEKMRELNKPLPIERWATVTAVSPLRVRPDGEASALDVTPVNLVGILSVNDRVRIAYGNKQLFVTDRLNGPLNMPIDTTSYTAAADWSIQTFRIRRIGNVATGQFVFTRTGANIAVTASGDIANNLVLTMAANSATGVGMRPIMTTPLTAGATGPTISGYVSENGTVTIASVAPGVTLNTGQQLSLGGTWLVN